MTFCFEGMPCQLVFRVLNVGGGSWRGTHDMLFDIVAFDMAVVSQEDLLSFLELAFTG